MDETVVAAEESINVAAYAGSAWLRRRLADRGIALSATGERVADLLGWVFDGIYHVEDAVLSKRAVWDNEVFVRVPLGWKSLSTYDDSYLTRLVVACHDLAIRMEINPSNIHYLELLFHPRTREGGHLYERHPTIEWQIKRFRKEGAG